jgi:hypothetical protein
VGSEGDISRDLSLEFGFLYHEFDQSKGTLNGGGGNYIMNNKFNIGFHLLSKYKCDYYALCGSDDMVTKNFFINLTKEDPNVTDVVSIKYDNKNTGVLIDVKNPGKSFHYGTSKKSKFIHNSTFEWLQSLLGRDYEISRKFNFLGRQMILNGFKSYLLQNGYENHKALWAPYNQTYNFTNQKYVNDLDINDINLRKLSEGQVLLSDITDIGIPKDYIKTDFIPEIIDNSPGSIVCLNHSTLSKLNCYVFHKCNEYIFLYNSIARFDRIKLYEPTKYDYMVFNVKNNIYGNTPDGLKKRVMDLSIK